MGKYIDADKLIAEIERRIEETKSMKPTFDQFWAGQISAFKGAIKITESLQQEQPVVDLEEEIFKAEKKYGDIDEMGGYQILLFDDEFRDILRHFYELGQIDAANKFDEIEYNRLREEVQENNERKEE